MITCQQKLSEMLSIPVPTVKIYTSLVKNTIEK